MFHKKVLFFLQFHLGIENVSINTLWIVLNMHEYPSLLSFFSPFDDCSSAERKRVRGRENGEEEKRG